MLRAPHDGFGAKQTRDPDRRMRFLNWQAPWIDEAIVEMLALVAERTRPRPGLNYDVMCFVEILAVEGGIGVRSKLLTTTATHPSWDQPATRDHIDHAQ